MHPLNRFRDGYDFPRLVAAHPPLATFVVRSPRDEETIDFADPVAVLTLNQALLKEAYGLQWSLPHGALCPPVPGRLDYIHHLADLLGGGDAADAPRGSDIAILNLCAGANCILPLLGASEDRLAVRGHGGGSGVALLGAGSIPCGSTGQSPGSSKDATSPMCAPVSRTSRPSASVSPPVRAIRPSMPRTRTPRPARPASAAI